MLQQRYLPFHCSLEHRPGDDQSIDLVGALEDAVDARVTKQALRLELLDEAVAAVDLNRLVGAVVHRLGAKYLDDRGLDAELLDDIDALAVCLCQRKPLIEQPGRS